jgi:hypothetical protein
MVFVFAGRHIHCQRQDTGVTDGLRQKTANWVLDTPVVAFGFPLSHTLFSCNNHLSVEQNGRRVGCRSWRHDWVGSLKGGGSGIRFTSSGGDFCGNPFDTHRIRDVFLSSWFFAFACSFCRLVVEGTNSDTRGLRNLGIW